MKSLLVLMCTLTIGFAYGQETKHQISFGANQSLELSGSSSKAEFDSSLNVEDYVNGSGNFSVNYLYSVSEKIQLGLSLYNKRSHSKIEFDSGSKSESISEDRGTYFLFNYNFNSELSRSWYLGFGFGRETFKEENEDTTGTKSDSESSVSASIFYFGKRFSLEFFGIKNLTYAPMISYHFGETSGDLEDDGIEEIRILTFDILKVDLLF